MKESAAGASPVTGTRTPALEEGEVNSEVAASKGGQGSLAKPKDEASDGGPGSCYLKPEASAPRGGHESPPKSEVFVLIRLTIRWFGVLYQ